MTLESIYPLYWSGRPASVHQVWIQGGPISNKFKEQYERTLEYCSSNSIDHKVWSIDDVNDLLSKKDDELSSLLKKKINSYPEWIQKVDLSKYIILYYLGGLYMDMDTCPKDRLKELLLEDKILLTRFERNVPLLEEWFPYLNNQVLYSPFPYHPFFKFLLIKALNEGPRKMELRIWYIVRSTGPGLVSKAYIDYSSAWSDIKVLSEDSLAEYITDEPVNSWFRNKNMFDIIDIILIILILLFSLFFLLGNILMDQK